MRDGTASRPSSAVGLAEIARLAGVSESTVSRVLNNKYGVAAATREKVMEATKAAGYARDLRGNVVLILSSNLAEPFFGMLSLRLEAELATYGLCAVVGSVSPGTLRERDYVERLVNRGLAAVVFLSGSNTLRDADPAAHQTLTVRGIPFVCIDGAFEGAPSAVFSTDHWRASELAVNHLADLGHDRIGLLAGPVGNVVSDRKAEGFVRTMLARSLPRDGRDPRSLIVRHDYSVEGGRTGTGRLLEELVTAIVAASDEMAFGALRALRDRGLSIPGDVSVIGFNDSYFLDYSEPPLTSVRQPVERLAASTSRAVARLIGGLEVPLDETLVDPELRLRSSTGPVPTKR